MCLKSNMTGFLIKRRNLDTSLHKGTVAHGDEDRDQSKGDCLFLEANDVEECYQTS